MNHKQCSHRRNGYDEIANYTSSSAEFVKKVSPNSSIAREMGVREAPVTNRKITELLGFRQDHPWQKCDEGRIKKNVIPFLANNFKSWIYLTLV